MVPLWNSIERACPAEQAKALAELQRERDGGGCKIWQNWAASHLLRAKMITRKARRNSVADERAQDGLTLSVSPSFRKRDRGLRQWREPQELVGHDYGFDSCVKYGSTGG